MIGNVVTLFALLFTVNAYLVDIIPCEDDFPTPVKLDVANCIDGPPCPLYRGESGKANITFDVPSDADSITVKVKATALGVTVNYPLDDPEACHFLVNGYCPLEEGEQVTYMMDVPVKKLYPTVKLTLKLMLYGPEEEKVACFKLPCQVVDRKF